MANTKLPARLLDTSAVPALNVTGDLIVDTTTLKVDSSNNRVGIGTTSPQAHLHVKGPQTSSGTAMRIDSDWGESEKTVEFTFGAVEVAKLIAFGRNSTGVNPYFAIEVNGTTSSGDTTTTSEKLRILSNGNVGIGTTSPSQKLETTGNIFINAASGNPDLTIKTAGAGNNPSVNYRAGDNIVFDNMLVASAATDYWRVGYGASGTVTSEYLAVTSAGNVGIGETSPSNLLHVKASDAGIAPHPSAQIVLERDGTNYLQFLTTAAGTSGLLFGDTNDIDVSKIYVDHNTTKMTFVNEASETMTLNGPNVGIGENSPLASLHIKQGDSGLTSVNAAAHHIFLEDSGANGPGITFASGTTSNCTLAFGDSDSNYQGFLLYDNSADAMKFGVAGSGEKLRIQSGGGISFNGDSAAANALDDYEEGTWNVAVTGQLTQYNVGQFTKIGNVCTVHFKFVCPSNSGSPTSPLYIGGLPFACGYSGVALLRIYNAKVANTGVSGAPTFVSGYHIWGDIGVNSNGFYVRSNSTSSNPYYRGDLTENGTILGGTFTYITNT